MKTALNGCLCTTLQNSVFTVGKIILFSAFIVLKWRHGIPISQTGTEEQWVVSGVRSGVSGARYADYLCSALAADSAGLGYFSGGFSGDTRAGDLPEPGADSPP